MLRLTSTLSVAAIIVLAAFTSRLGDTPTLPATPYNYANIALPAHLQAPPIRGEDNTPADNATTDAGATLGRVLFYDTRLSANETVSCASCHRQSEGFSDSATLSTGFAGGQTGRQSMGLAFSRFYARGTYFWDERAPTLEHQVLMPIQDGVEMGMTLEGVVTRLQATTFYGPLFNEAFGSAEITSDRMSKALAQFVRSMVAPHSRYDSARVNQPPGPPLPPLSGLTMQENMGMQLFNGRGRCAQCHRGDLFVGDIPRNNGLDASPVDLGAGNGTFKASSLRNIDVTAPYMHDGRFATLEQVVDHYSTGMQPSPGLDVRLRNGNGDPFRFNFSAHQKAALVAFLKTLTDRSFLTDPRWSDPFNAVLANGPDAGRFGLRIEMAGANPLRLSTEVRIVGEQGRPVVVEAFSLAGRRVARLYDGPATGTVIRWDASGLAPGIYVIRATAGAQIASKTVTLLR